MTQGNTGAGGFFPMPNPADYQMLIKKSGIAPIIQNLPQVGPFIEAANNLTTPAKSGKSGKSSKTGKTARSGKNAPAADASALSVFNPFVVPIPGWLGKTTKAAQQNPFDISKLLDSKA